MTLPDLERWRRISPLLDGLLDLPPGPRAERLAALRGHDPALADELAALIADAARAEAAQFLAGAAAPLADAQSSVAPTLVGARIGAYVLETPLGQGGMGAVWRARRADGRFAGHVAIKLLHLSLISRDGMRRFEREGQVLARLSHPNIARLLDAGVTEGGQPYLVLELVEGARIDHHCDAQRLRIDQRVALFRAVLEAVAHAHRHLVIHRDIKPSNILVGSDGAVKLLDFGIAKLLQRDDDAPLTDLTGGLRGGLTPDYAAPEQLRAEAVTTATDVYALGVLLYQLLTGQHPTAPPHATPADLMRTTLETDPGRLSTAVTAGHGVPSWNVERIATERDTSAPRLKRQLGGDLENIVAKALRKLPAERYPTVDAFNEDLRRWAASEPVSARPDSLGYRTARFVKRHRGKVAAGALTFVAIIAGLVGTITQARRAEQQAQLARVERDHALRDLAFAGAARDLLGFMFSQGGSTPLTASELLARAEQLSEQQFVDDPLSRGRLQLMLGIEYGNVMEFEKSKAVLARAQAAARSASDPELLSNVDCLLAATLGDQNEPQRALELFGSAIQRLQAEAGMGSVLAACLHMRADLHAHMGQPAAMLSDAQAALAALGAPRPDERVLANSLGITIAEAYGRLGQMPQALAAYERSIADLASMGRQQTARAGVRYANFSRMLYMAGQASRAEQIAAQGLATSRGSAAAGTELDAILEGNRARALVELGRLDEAKALTEHALASALERKDVRWTGTFALYGAPAWCDSGDLSRCASLLAIAREKLQAALPAGHSTLGIVELLAARLAQAEGQPALAREQAARALAIFDAASDKNPLRIRALTALARSEQAAGDPSAALTHAAAAVAQARDVSKGLAASEWLGDALLAQAVVQRARNDSAAAQASLREALPQLQGSIGEQAPATREARAMLGGA